jgi:hypothetical protein
MVVYARTPQGFVCTAPTSPCLLPVFSLPLSYMFDIITVANISCLFMENEARLRAQVLLSHNVEELRAFLQEKANEPPPQPASYMIGGVVRAVLPELNGLRKRGYTLNMLVRIFAENGLRITATALCGYMKRLNEEADGVPARGERRRTTQPSTSGSEARRHLGMKPDVSL